MQEGTCEEVSAIVKANQATMHITDFLGQTGNNILKENENENENKNENTSNRKDLDIFTFSDSSIY